MCNQYPIRYEALCNQYPVKYEALCSLHPVRYEALCSQNPVRYEALCTPVPCEERGIVQPVPSEVLNYVQECSNTKNLNDFVIIEMSLRQQTWDVINCLERRTRFVLQFHKVAEACDGI